MIFNKLNAYQQSLAKMHLGRNEQTSQFGNRIKYILCPPKRIKSARENLCKVKHFLIGCKKQGCRAEDVSVGKRTR